MLSRAMFLLGSLSKAKDPVVFDRGIPDMIAYAELFGIDRALYERAAANHRYNRRVFYFAGRKEIYALDEERKMDFESATRFGENVMRIYKGLDYAIIEVPLTDIEKRAQFIIDAIEESFHAPH
jgi:predicted ATPase